MKVPLMSAVANVSVEISTGADDGGTFESGSVFAITYSDAGAIGAGQAFDAYFTFRAVPLIQGVTIKSAYLRLKAGLNSGYSGTDARTKISANDVDDASPPTTYAGYHALVETAAKVDWDSTVQWVDDQTYTSPDIKTVIQEIVDRGSWVSGNDLTILWKNDGSSGANSVRDGGDSADGRAARLLVSF